MRHATQRVYRNFRQAQQEAHTAVVQVAAKDVPPQMAEWWSDLRRGRLNVLGGTLRTIDVLKQQGRQDLAITLGEVVLDYAKSDEGEAA